MVYNDYAQVGGERFSVRAEFDSLLRRGVDARLLTISNADVLEAKGTRGLTLEAIRPRLSTALLRQALDDFQPDLVHAQNLFPLFGGRAIELLRERKVPWIRSLRNYRLRCIAGTCFRGGHDCGECRSADRGLNGVRHSCYRQSAPASAAAVAYAITESRQTDRYPPDAYVLLSEAMLEPLSTVLGAERIFIKPNAVPGAADGAIVPRSARNLDAVFVGRLTPEKGVTSLINSFAGSTRVRLTLIGEGALSASDRRIVDGSDLIEVVGPLPSQGVAERMGRALAVLVPSQWAEPFGRVAAEGLGAGTPVLCSGNGGLPEIVAPLSLGGELVRRNQDWLQGAEMLADLPADVYDRLAAEGHRRWQDHYSEGPVGDALIDIYSTVLQNPRTRA
ncbi:glycosyltransferase [Microbacterium sp. zg.Y909]|uniref:glycosyltransferase n=1 Tax=Microbacterium sp. zg.Y909 TaxID=2969413 RepID=UPI00214CE569|nr:glycosyltransferase [Microbacterium sp. zg.Y909]MCR2824242.1 glycosyltransferase [Microbacterium sp. zg.Y909]